jgi:hypothetical protein
MSHNATSAVFHWWRRAQSCPILRGQNTFRIHILTRSCWALEELLGAETFLGPIMESTVFSGAPGPRRGQFSHLPVVPRNSHVTHFDPKKAFCAEMCWEGHALTGPCHWPHILHLLGLGHNGGVMGRWTRRTVTDPKCNITGALCFLIWVLICLLTFI